jgi:nickel-dependent lactate racemase
MLVGLEYGREHLDVEVPDHKLIGVHREPLAPALADPVAAVCQALESPLGFPPLRRALTPDDHVAVVLDEYFLRLPELLPPVLEHLAKAHVAPGAITLLCPPTIDARAGSDALVAVFPHVRIEVHNPSDRQQLSYLATTRRGRRIYLNRTAVDADQLLVLARRSYDPLLGYSGPEGSLFPALSDEATLKEMGSHLSLQVPGTKPWPVRQEAAEVAWLLGAPFMVQLIEGAGDSVAQVLGGLAETGDEGVRLLNARWQLSVDSLADTVIASVSGNGVQQTFAALAEALACAARVVKPQGRIVLLSSAAPSLGAGAELLREADDAEEALKRIRRSAPADMAAAFQWASAAKRANLYVLSKLSGEAVEELFATPLDEAAQVQRLVNSAESCLWLEDAHKTLAVPTHDAA